MRFREVIGVYSENNAKHTDTLRSKSSSVKRAVNIVAVVIWKVNNYEYKKTDAI
jgi:Cu2+-containing amine oxidase